MKQVSAEYSTESITSGGELASQGRLFETRVLKYKESFCNFSAEKYATLRHLKHISDFSFSFFFVYFILN